MSNVVAISNDWSRSSALARWFADPLVREIMVNAGREIWIEREGGVEHVGTLGSGELIRIIERILLPIGRRVDQASPVVDARLADGSRVCIVIPPVAVDGPCLSIRRFHVRDLPLSAFGDDDVVSLLRDIVAQRCNVVVAGAASSGKTTLLNALCGVSKRVSDSSPWRTSPNCVFKPSTYFDSRPAQRHTTARWKSDSRPSCAVHCACVPTGSYSAKCGAVKHSTC